VVVVVFQTRASVDGPAASDNAAGLVNGLDHHSVPAGSSSSQQTVMSSVDGFNSSSTVTTLTDQSSSSSSIIIINHHHQSSPCFTNIQLCLFCHWIISKILIVQSLGHSSDL